MFIVSGWSQRRRRRFQVEFTDEADRDQSEQATHESHALRSHGKLTC